MVKNRLVEHEKTKPIFGSEFVVHSKDMDSLFEKTKPISK
jgi:hypothetical protein